MELKITTLQASAKAAKTTLLEAKKAKYEAGYQNGVNGYMKSTMEMFPDLDWAKLGEDAATMAESIKKKKVAVVPLLSKEPVKPITDTEVPATVASVEVHSAEPQPIDSTPTVAMDETTSKTPTP